MYNKLREIFKNKTVLIMIVSVLILAVGIVAAALTGVFNSTLRSADTSGEDGITTVQETPNNTKYTASLADSVVEIIAEESDSLGVDLTSAFRLVFNKGTDEQAVSSSLSIEPEQSFSIKKLSGTEFSMKFDKPMESNSIYSITLNDKNTGAKKSWAFQTKKQFSIVRTMPRDKATYVPVQSGIEIAFSHEGFENAEEYFEITPGVKGRFEYNKKALVFVPGEDLQPGTIYTVTIKRGIGVSGSDETLQNDHTFSFQTATADDVDKSYFSFADHMYNFTPQAVPALQVYAQSDLLDTEVPVELYIYPDADSFLKDLSEASARPNWAIGSNRSHYDKASLIKAASVNGKIVQYIESYWSTEYILLPQSLPEGYYLAAADINGEKFYTQLQINKASVYIMTTNDKSLVWLNDTTNGQPMADAVFRSDQGGTAKTDSRGLAVLEVPLADSEASEHYFLIEPKSGLPFVANIANNSYDPWYGRYNADITDNYWTYMYLDRGMYLPSDTINVWGILKPRNSRSSETEAVLELIRYDYSMSGEGNASVLTSQNVTLSPDGTFNGKLKTDNYNPGSYEVRLRLGERVMLTGYLQIMDYIKPIYKVEIKPDRSYMYAWETVDYDIFTSFYEGTPASGLKLDYYSMTTYEDSKKGILTSDAQGVSRLSVKPATPERGWRPVTQTLSVYNSDAQEQRVSEYSNIKVFPKDTMIETDTKTENGVGTITFTTSRIDISGLDDSTDSYPSVDEYRGASVDIPVTVKLFERYFEKKKTGDYYDYINKVRRDIYEYNMVQKPVREYNFTTVDGKYELTYTSEKDKSYMIEVSGEDSRGNPIWEAIYIYSWDSYDPYNSSTYSIAQDSSVKQYKSDEQVTVEVKRNRESSDAAGNEKYLFVRMKNGIADYKVSDSAKYGFVFDTNCIPNTYVKAICFDGIGIYDAGMTQYRYDSSEKNLNIAIKPDKDSYRPGDEVKLAIEVKDTDGRPVSSEVNISIVDEAFFALYQQYVDILGSLYNMPVTSGFLSEYLSYEPIGDFGPSMAEGGGDGGDNSIRRDFKDTAVFITASTGTDGKAEVSFKLSDNLTSWRITCQAVTQEVQAGDSVTNIAVKLPFFVDTVFNKAFISGDSPSILVKANGTELSAGREVDFEVIVTREDGFSGSLSAKGTANIYQEIPLGTLEAGEYTIRVKGSCGNLSDMLERTFRVSGSLLETSVTDIMPLTEGISAANDAKGLTTLVFYNEDSSVLYSELRSLYWTWGNRLDQVLARKVSGKVLQNYFNEERYVEEEFDLKKYQMDDGGLALLSYDSSSPEISAKMCSLAADGIDTGALTSYFRRLTESEDTMPEDIIYAYWGLAALKEPVLLDIHSILGTQKLDTKSKLVLGAALAEIGDHSGAAEIYREVLESSGTVTDTLAWIGSGNRDDSIELTALCSLIAMKTNAPEIMKLFSYINSNSTSKLLVNLERMIFVTNYIKDTSLETSFSYELDGTKKRIELQKGSSFKLVLTPEKLASVKFSDISGNIRLARSYVAPISEIMRAGGDIVSITRTYGNSNKSVTEFDRSDKVKISLQLDFDENAPDGYYEITDVLPAGFRYMEPVYGENDVDKYLDYPKEVTGQKVVFGYYYNKSRKNRNDDNTIEYYAVAVSPGIYTADNAAIRHTDQDIAGFTGKEQITISNK